MQRNKVVSSNIAEIGYDPTKQILEILFLNGYIYHYINVPENIYDAMMKAPSKGKFLNAKIKKAFRYTQIS